MPFANRVLLFLTLFVSLHGEEAEIPYAGIYAQCKEFPDYISFQFVCSEPSASPIAVTIQAHGIVRQALALNAQGYTRIPLNEAWVNEDAVLHCNRPKGSMTLTSTFHFFYYSNLVNQNGHVDLGNLVQSQQDFLRKMPRIEEIIKKKIDIDADKYMRVRSLKPQIFRLVLTYTKDGTRFESKQTSSEGTVLVSLSDIYGSQGASLEIDPPDTEVAFDQPSLDESRR